MKIGPTAGQAAGIAAREPRLDLRAASPARLPAPGNPTAELPAAIAERLANLMEADPALAEAVSARLPAARLQSASDLAAYTLTTTTGTALDIHG